VEFDKAVAELETLVRTLEREGDERALLLLQLVDAIHRPVLQRLARGELDDPLVQAVLAMYGLGDEVDDEELVEDALDSVRPYIHSHGGEVELLSVEDGVVHLRLAGSCVGCAASSMTLKRGIEEALRAGYPAFREVVAHEPEGPRLLQIEDLRRPSFAEAGPPPAELAAVRVDGVPVLLLNVEGDVYAYRNACPVDGSPLDGGRLARGVLVCPWHNCAYDARSGERADGEPGDALTAVPIALSDGTVRVAVNVL
jgi:Fe-S cluster biogenesis protein NfuA/nitrite reductase/ring-hydroxylating ferredoxin subunit